MDTTTFTVRTGSRFQCADLTMEVADWIRGKGDGLCHVFVPHATAGVALIETGSGTEQDVEAVLEALLPHEDGRWVHGHGSPGHGADHVLPAIVSSSVTIPVLNGRMALGTWQSIVLVDPNANNPVRTVRVSFLASP
ncbi:MAG: secondary thiamine-phosphate synthase enzyme YjbQ [Egibacteraceae bacterium]